MQLFDPGYNDRWRPHLSAVLATVFDVDERNYEAIGKGLRSGARIAAEPLFVNMKSAEAMSKLRLRISMSAA
jgi:hypothetical protein